MNYEKTEEYMNKQFDTNIIPKLCEFIKIDNLSPSYDPEWASNGKAERAATLLLDWAKDQNVKGFKGEIIKEENLSPIIFIEIESNGGTGNCFMYGHFDKQPHMEGWRDGLGPLLPVIENGLLYGRGGADDGYAIFTSIISIKAIQDFGAKHGKVTILIEGSEESSSIHLFPYIDKLKTRIGNPDMVVCMDSGCKDYDRLWITSSLRGCAIVDLTVKCLKESCHSGLAGGHGADSFSVIRELLDRVDNSKTGEVNSKFQVEIPKSKYEEAKKVSSVLGKGFALVKPLDGVNFLKEDPEELYLNGTWKASLTVVGQTGLPSHFTSGNVLRDSTSVRLSLRLPPTMDSKQAGKDLVEILTKDPPHNSKIEAKLQGAGNGFASKDFSEKLMSSFNKASLAFWKKESIGFGEGGSIPFLNDLQGRFPKSEFVVLGLLGPGSNAHAPNEFLHIPYCKKLTSSLSHVVADFFQ